MRELERLHERSAEIDSCLDQIEAADKARGGQGFTEGERAEYDRMIAEKRTVKAKIDRLEASERAAVDDWDSRRGAEVRERLAERIGEAARGSDGVRIDGVTGLPVRSFTPRAVPQSKPFEGRRYADLFGPATGRDGFADAEEFFRCVHSGLQDQRFATMGSGVGGAGGFLIPEQFAAQQLDHALEDEIIRPRADVHPMTAPTKKIAGLDASDNSTSAPYGITSSWVAENSTATDQEGKVRVITLTAKKCLNYIGASNELVADGASFESLLGGAMKKSISWTMDDAFFNGNGVARPLGVLNDPALVTVAKETGQAASTIQYENLTKMLARIHPASFNNAVWVASSTCIPQLLSLSIPVGTGGSHFPVLTESNGEFRILTRPCLFTEKVPSIGNEGDIGLYDFSQYAIGIRKMVMLEKSAHAGWYKDQTSYRVIVRADGMGKWASAFTPKNGDTLSWCVTLAERA